MEPQGAPSSQRVVHDSLCRAKSDSISDELCDLGALCGDPKRHLRETYELVVSLALGGSARELCRRETQELEEPLSTDLKYFRITNYFE